MSTKSAMGTNGTGRRNHSWPEGLKREIVAASFAPGSSVSIVARRYDVNANQVFSWRKRYRDATGGAAAPPGPQLIPVMVTADQAGARLPSSVAEKIEIEVAGKYHVRVGMGGEIPGDRRQCMRSQHVVVVEKRDEVAGRKTDRGIGCRRDAALRAAVHDSDARIACRALEDGADIRFR